MNQNWYAHLEKKLQTKKDKDLFRILLPLEHGQGKNIVLNGKELINFSSNDYLDLSCHEQVLHQGIELSKAWGCGATASRLICGTTKPTCDLEKNIHRWLVSAYQSRKFDSLDNRQALIFNSGYHANVGLISALADRDTVIFCDRLNHASIYDGAGLSRAALERYNHLDAKELGSKLEKHRHKSKKLIIADSIFSVDGDASPLEEIADLSKKFNCLLMVDEAHSIGVFGEKGTGIASEKNLFDKVDILMGTFGKAFGVFGAFVWADPLIIDHLINGCRSFIFTTALPPFIIGAINESLRIIQNENRGKILLDKAQKFRKRLSELNIPTGQSVSQIIPIITGGNKSAMALSSYLRENGFFAPAIRPPTVPENSSRIRLSLCHHHTNEDLDNLSKSLDSWFRDFDKKGLAQI